MSGYQQRFNDADYFLTHLDDMIAQINDPLVRQQYVVYVSVSAVTAYELAFKDIIFNFSDKKHRALGQITRSIFDRVNGQIKISDIKGRHICRFGDKYVDRFTDFLSERDSDFLRLHSISIISSYGNIITWRHNFAHTGKAPTTTTYEEVKRAYQAGKEVFRCLELAMVR